MTILTILVTFFLTILQTNLTILPPADYSNYFDGHPDHPSDYYEHQGDSPDYPGKYTDNPDDYTYCSNQPNYPGDCPDDQLE